MWPITHTANIPVKVTVTYMTTEQVDARPVLASALVTAIDHVGIAVPDLDAAIKWYHDHLGMIVLHEEVNEDQGIREAMLSVRGAPKGSAQIQLMAPLDETSTIAKFIDKRGPGLQQFAYRVSDIDALSERLREQTASGCSTTRRAAAPRTRGSTSSTPRMPAACWSSSSSPPPTSTDLYDHFRVGPRVARLPSTACASAAGRPSPTHRGRRATPPRGRARPDLVIAAGAAVGLGRPRRRRPAAPRSRIRPARSRRDATRQRRSRPLPRGGVRRLAMRPVLGRQNSRNSLLSSPRIWS